MRNNIYIIGLDMEEKDAEEIAGEATSKISELVEHLLEEKDQLDKSKKEEQLL